MMAWDWAKNEGSHHVSIIEPRHGPDLIQLALAIGLHWLALKLRWPPATALLVGGGGLAFVPGYRRSRSIPNSRSSCSCHRC
jgi:hypothetical protein